MTTAPTLPTVQFGTPMWWLARFDQCHPITAKWEGGEVNHKDDPGGHTNLGVTQAVYTDWRKRKGLGYQSVSKITKGEAAEIYRDEYWTPTAVKYNLVPGVDMVTYDAGVNSGVSRGIKWLIAGSSKSNDHVATVKGICKQRLNFVQALKTWKTFGKGWLNRITDVQAKGVAMAAAYIALGDRARVEDELSKGVKEAEKDRASNAGKATGAGGAGAAGGAGTTQTDVVDPTIISPEAAQLLMYGLLAAGVVFAAYFIIKTVIAKSERDAYKKELNNG